MELRRDDLVRAGSERDRRRADRLATVNQEIRQAQAEALGRTGERPRQILDRLAGWDRRLDALLGGAATGSVEPDLVRSETAARDRLRDEAVRIRHHLIIQREALSLARQLVVEQCYPVPARRRGSVSAEERGRTP